MLASGSVRVVFYFPPFLFFTEGKKHAPLPHLKWWVQHPIQGAVPGAALLHAVGMGLGKAAKVGSRGTGEAEELCGSSVAATFESGLFFLYVNGTDCFRS